VHLKGGFLLVRKVSLFRYGQIIAEKLITELFGERLKAARQSRNYSRDKLASLMQTDKSHIWRLENGRTNPRLDTIIKISEVLGISCSALIPIYSSIRG